MKRLLNDHQLKQGLAVAGIHRRLLDTDHDHRHQLSTSGKNGTDYVTDASFDTNMVIILAALLCALIFALGLNSIVRCVLRCGRGGARPPVAAAGLKKRELRQIPVAVYGAAESCKQPGTECAICLGDFADGERVRVLPKCNHAFHVACIDTWLLSHSSCPNCRHSLVLDRPGNQPAGAAQADC